MPHLRASVSTILLILALPFATATGSAARPSTTSVARAAVFADFGCRGPQVRPHLIVLTCADAGLYVHKIRWPRWGGSVAKGRGTVTYNDCNPACAGGHFHNVPGARLRASRISFCPNTGHDQYRHLIVGSSAFTNRRHRYVVTVGCRTLGAPRLSVSAAAACAAPSDVYTAFALRTKHTTCRVARNVVRVWYRHSGDCGTGTDYGSAQSNTCDVRASRVHFFCSTHYAYAQVSKTTCTAGHRIVKFRYDPS